MSMIETNVKNMPDFAKGSVWEWYGEVKDEDGDAVNISGWTVYVKVYDGSTLKFTVTADCASNGASGRYDVAGTSTETNKCTGGQTYDVEVFRHTADGFTPMYKGRVKCLNWIYEGA